MASGKRNSSKRTRVLADHMQQGKVFLPPAMQLPNLHYVKWIDDIMPELVWIAALQDRLGLRAGIQAAAALACAATQLAPRDLQPWYTSTSAYTELTSEEKRSIVASLARQGILEDLQEGLWVLARFYPNCPLNFVVHSESPVIFDPESSLVGFKSCLAKLYDRRDRESTLMQATAIHIMMLTGKLHFCQPVQPPDLQTLEHYPLTESSRQTAARVRALINSYEQEICGSGDWPRYFWNRGLMIDPCEPNI